MLTTLFGSKEKTKKTIKEVVIEFLQHKEFQYEVHNETTFIVPLSGENGSWKTIFFIDEEREVLQIRSYSPITLKDNQKIRIAELITRINSHSYLGCFVMNFEEGELSYKTVHLLVKSELNFEALNILFRINAQTIDDYLPAISAVHSGFTEPCLAVQ
jgi:hypothetical protein